MAQNINNYAANWKRVQDFESKGLTKSALQEVLTIYQLAIKDRNDAQQIKSSMYQVKYRNMVEEDSRENNLLFADTLIARAKSPAKNILQSMQAEMYWLYLQRNRYKFYSRTKQVEENSKDISTWSLDKLHATITALYKASLSNDQLLKNTRLEGFDPIIVKGQNTRNLRPTLYDFLAHRALSYFMNDERDLTRPAFQFTIKDSSAFAPVAEFSKAVFRTEDTASLHYTSIGLLQEILRFHLADANKSALLDADLIRLQFVYQYAVNENKQSLYETALKNIEAEYSSNPGVAQAMYSRARIYYEKGLSFHPFTNTGPQYEIKRARELCVEASRKFPKSTGAVNCANLITQIDQPSLALQTEKVNVPNQPFRTLVTYKNAATVYFRLVPVAKDAIKKISHTDYNQYWKEIIQLKPSKSWKVPLPDQQDYQQHAAEIKVDALANGRYLLIASLDENFTMQQNILAKQLFYVSNISFVHNTNGEYHVLHRQNGEPLANTMVQVWESRYNYSINRNEEIKAEQYTTDKNGYFKIKQAGEYRQYLLQLIHKTDELFMEENNYSNQYNGNEQEQKPITFLFTDRSIYRPGQTIFFKGIVLKKASPAAESATMEGFKTALQLKDANGQKISELQVVTNAYGSYHGNFKLPEGLLNGQFTLSDESTNANHYIQVEEYKRPGFLVEVVKPSGTYRLYDSVSVSGNAKAYAGNYIDGATVKYRVVRKVRYPIWWSRGYGGKIMPPGRSTAAMEITNGTSVTGKNGEFNIRFKALPDESIPKKDQPTFYYEVAATITDINGETRSGETTVAVAYQALQLNIEAPGKINADSTSNIIITSTNTNDIFEKALVQVSVFQLIPPGKIFRERFWEMPDQFVMSREAYYGYFPYDAYKDENDPANWPLDKKLVDKSDSTSANGLSFMGQTKLPPGWYKIIAATMDKYGEKVEAIRIVQVLEGNKRKQNVAIETPVEIITQQKTAIPGDKINYSIQTGFEKTWMIHTLSKMDKSNKITYHELKRNQPFEQEIGVAENDRGGMSVSYVFVQHNRVYSGEENFSIPWDNKELSIDYQTFRDKLLPGSEEKWTATIRGKKGEKMAAEILVGMYDASLDQFRPHGWSALNIWPLHYNRYTWSGNGFGSIQSEVFNKQLYNYQSASPKSYDELLPVYSMYNNGPIRIRGANNNILNRDVEAPGRDAAPALQEMAMQQDGRMYKNQQVAGEAGIVGEQESSADSTIVKKTGSVNMDIPIRRNFNETAFFFPDLTTDTSGNVSFSFKMPEAMTEWKLMTLAHTNTLASGYLEKQLVTQKPLMVQPNAPRFMREGDRMEFSAKIVNLSTEEITGTTQLELLDAATNKPVDGWFKNVFQNQYFTVAAGQSVAVKFPMEIPFNFNSALTYRVTAKSTGNTTNGAGVSFSDGEEMALPILTNRMLVTESLPLNLRNTNQKEFKFTKLLNSNNSNTLTNHGLTVEFTTNPVWYAVQALPYLMEYPYDCAEQIFNRYYANSLATYVSNSAPKIKEVFLKWQADSSAENREGALLSNLQKNEALKSVLLEETPWVLDAQNETLQKKNIALLFDMVKMSSEQQKAINQLKEMQSPNGGFVWFKGGPDDRYMTQYILTGIGHLRQLNALSPIHYDLVKPVVDKAIPYLDQKIKESYDQLVKQKALLRNNQTGYIAIQYLYMRSFFNEYPIPAASQTAYNYYREQIKRYWLKNSKYMQAMIALALHRTNDAVTPPAIIKSLKQNAINHEELGMYWKEWSSGGGYYWYQAPIESQSMVIEAFTVIDKNNATINELKTWLLKQKQTQNWKTTRATAEACYALLLEGNTGLAAGRLQEEKEVIIRLGNSTVNSSEEHTEAGSGYFKKTLAAKDVNAGMGNITVTLKPIKSKKTTAQQGTTSWGAVYWQYFEDLDKITAASTPLKLAKQLFIEKNTAKGPVLEAIIDGANLQVGDKVKVRIELKVDRDMEYIHMKDMRAACMEPVNVISGYKYQGGLGYYESTKDASTNFFFGWLPRGTYVFEYPLYVTHSGNYSNGITTIQSMYAPEFSSHSEGIRVNVEAVKPQ